MCTLPCSTFGAFCSLPTTLSAAVHSMRGLMRGRSHCGRPIQTLVRASGPPLLHAHTCHHTHGTDPSCTIRDPPSVT